MFINSLNSLFCIVPSVAIYLVKIFVSLFYSVLLGGQMAVYNAYTRVKDVKAKRYASFVTSNALKTSFNFTARYRTFKGQSFFIKHSSENSY